MGKADRELLNQILSSHLSTIHETFQILDQTPASSLTKVSWDEVIKMGDQVSKQATIVGMLWTGGIPKAKEVEENMTTYFNTLQGFLLLSHGSMVGAGPTLSSTMRASFKLVVDSSFKLMMETVSSYGAHNNELKLRVPQLVGAVWEACSALKKTPAMNVTAIGRAMTQVAVSMKDVLREMKELKPSSSTPANEALDVASDNEESRHSDNDNSSDDDLGNDLSAEEMKVAQLGISVFSDALTVIKELIRTITGLIKLEKPGDNGSFVDSMEKLLQLCQGIGVNIDELGACLYPPQEAPAIKASLENVSCLVSDVQKELDSFKSSSDAFFQACNDLKSSVKLMESEVDSNSTGDIETKMESISVND